MVLSNPWFQGFVFVAVGAFAALAVSVYYAREASRDAQRQITMLERQNRMLQTLLITMEEDKGGALELARDKDGNITGGRVIPLQAAAVVSSSAVGNLTAALASPARPHAPKPTTS
jgi:hypothetical protein